MRYSATVPVGGDADHSESESKIQVIIKARYMYEEEEQKEIKIPKHIDPLWTGAKIWKEFVLEQTNEGNNRKLYKQTLKTLYYAIEGAAAIHENRIEFPFDKTLRDFLDQDLLPKVNDALSGEKLELHYTEGMFNMLCPRLFLGNWSSVVLNHHPSDSLFSHSGSRHNQIQ